MTVQLTAYPVRPREGWTLEPAKLQRDWMDQSIRRSAYRCLPMAMANQAGWMVGCPATFKARWTAAKPDAPVKITYSDEKDARGGSVASMFGSGIVSFILPWLFRTSSGIGLWVRGPANMPKSDCMALKGLVETDWSPYPFTMNWKINKPKIDVWFKKGEPICMLTPFPMGLLEDVSPRQEMIEFQKELHQNFDQAVAQRRESIQTRAPLDEGKWELTYMQGRCPDGARAPEHRSNLKLAAFEDET